MSQITEPPVHGRRSFLGRAAVGGALAGAALVPSLLGGEPAAAIGGVPMKPDKPKGSHRVFDVTDYGAKGDGKKDDTKPIQQAIDAAQRAGGGTVYLPSGSYRTTKTLLVTGSNVNVEGEGASSLIVCAFVDGDILRVARAAGTTTLVANGLFRDFAFRSTVEKNSGAALAMDGVQDMRVENIHAVSRVHSSPNNLWDAFTFHDFTIVVMENCKIQARNVGITCWGHEVGADIWITGGTLCSFTPTGVRVGGGVGGVYFDEFLCYLNGTNVLIDSELGDGANRELIFNEVVLDGSYQHNVEIKQNGVYVLTFQNTWFSNSGFGAQGGHPDGCLLRVHPDAILHPSNVTMSGCKLFNGYGSGAFIESGAWTITGCDISLNGQGPAGGYGILLASPTPGTLISGNTIRTNGAYPEPRPLGVGIGVAPGVDGYMVTNNLVTDNGSLGIDDQGGSNKIVETNLV